MSNTVVNLNSQVARSSDLISSSVSGQTALMSVASGSYYGLDPVGSRIWELIAEPCRVRSVCAQLLAEFVVDQAQCETQVLAFLQRLANDGLLCVSHEQPPA